MYPQIYVLRNNKKNITIFHLEIIIFTAIKNRSLLHGLVCIMYILYQVSIFLRLKPQAEEEGFSLIVKHSVYAQPSA